jgi:hypothetical protein
MIHFLQLMVNVKQLCQSWDRHSLQREIKISC